LARRALVMTLACYGALEIAGVIIIINIDLGKPGGVTKHGTARDTPRASRAPRRNT